MIEIIKKTDMAAIREGKGLPKVQNKKNPKAKKSERETMMDELKKSNVEFKGNASNAELRVLIEENK